MPTSKLGLEGIVSKRLRLRWANARLAKDEESGAPAMQQEASGSDIKRQR
jgi:hypothetical protein